ncbi:cytochrome P450 [Mycena floridula]|nr:cytochrome P450 [Mycena floridula]
MSVVFPRLPHLGFMATFLDVAISVSLLSCALALWFRSRKASSYHSLRLPPGPPRDFLLGHFRYFPKKDAHKVFHEWSQTYGDVICLSALGRNIIVLDSMEAANDLLDTRSAIHSCRSESTVMEMIELPPNLPTLPYGKAFLKQRRLFHQYLGPRTSDTYRSIQLREAHILANNFLEHGADQYNRYLSRFATSIIVKIAFGYDLSPSPDDPFLKILDDFGWKMSTGGPVSMTTVDAFPFLKNAPSWFPGTHYANWARSVRPSARQIHEYPFQILLQHIAEGNPDACILSSELEKRGLEDLEHLQDIKGTAVSMYLAGSGTTKSTMLVFLLAMILHPECQRRCQEELDAVVGHDRLPDFNDRESLPYLECVLHEVMRWHPVVPIGVAHRSTEDDVYRGMFIPKGSIIMPNISGMTQDERKHAEPQKFNPSRFLPKPEGGGEIHQPINFGWGRRICPGKDLAENSLFISMAMLLAIFNLSKAIDEDGKEITPEVAMDQAFIRRMAPFKFLISPRSAKTAALCRESKS